MLRARGSRTLPAAVLAGLVIPGAALAQDAAKYYEENCLVCHSIGGGDQAGPDLKGSTERNDRTWLVRFLQDPEGVFKSGDPYAVKLVGQWNGVVMPATEGLTHEMAEALLDYIARESRTAGGASAAPPPLVFTAADRARGLDLFTGRTRLANTGPACVACHALGGAGGPGGGALGPDLTAARTRLGDSRGAMAWLARPPTPMMRAIYHRASLTEDESRSLAALFDSVAPETADLASTQRRQLAVAGLAGAAAGLLAIGLAWRGRLRTVRRRLLEGGRGRNGR